MPTSAEVVKTIEAEITRVARIHEADELCHKSGSNGWLYQHGKAESLRGILWWLRQNRDALTADSPEPDSLDRYTLAAAEFYGVHPSDVTPHHVSE